MMTEAEGQSDATAGFEERKGPRAQEMCTASLAAGNEFSPEPSEEMQPC